MATLYRWPEAHGIPSLSPACIQVEAYLRMTGQEFVIQSCSTTTKSPTGMLPAVEVQGQFPSAVRSEFAAARSCIALARKALKDLDQPLGPAAQAEILAFTSLIEQKLDAATEYSTWVEARGYKAHVQVAYAHQPFPLNYVMPFNARREVIRRWADVDPEAVYSGAVEVLSALADKLRASSTSGPFLLGAKPCSLDALVFGHLVFYRSSPCAAEVLQSAVTGHPVLSQYVTHILNTFFSTPVPTITQAGLVPDSSASTAAGAPTGSDDGSGGSGGPQWSDAGKGRRKPPTPPEMTAAEKEFRRKSWWWLGGAAAVIAGYVLLSGRYINVEQLVQALGQGEDVGDEDGEEEHEEAEEEDDHNDRED